MSTSRWKRDWDFTIESIKGKRSRTGGSRERRSTLRQRISSGDPLLDAVFLSSTCTISFAQLDWLSLRDAHNLFRNHSDPTELFVYE